MPRTSPKDIEFIKALKKAIELRAFGVQYSEIIEQIKKADGEPYWKSVQACQKVVAKALEDDLDQSKELARNIILNRKDRQIFKLMDRFDKNGSVLVSREIDRVDDQIAKLLGLYAPTKIAETDKNGNDKPSKIIIEYVEADHAQNSETSSESDADIE